MTWISWILDIGYLRLDLYFIGYWKYISLDTSLDAEYQIVKYYWIQCSGTVNIMGYCG